MGLERPVAIEHSVVLPGGPDDTGEAISQCDGGFVVSRATFAVERPTPKVVERSAGALSAPGREQRRACTVHDERS